MNHLRCAPVSHKNRPREAMGALYFRFFEEAVQQGRFFVGHECDSQEPSLWDAGFPNVAGLDPAIQRDGSFRRRESRLTSPSRQRDGLGAGFAPPLPTQSRLRGAPVTKKPSLSPAFTGSLQDATRHTSAWVLRTHSTQSPPGDSPGDSPGVSPVGGRSPLTGRF